MDKPTQPFCTICEKPFQRFPISNKKRGKNRRSIKRPSNSITCSKKCSLIYTSLTRKLRLVRIKGGPSAKIGLVVEEDIVEESKTI